MAIPHLYRAPDELIAAGAFHAVDAQVGATDADRVFRRPGARWIVLGRDQAMARIHRRGHRRAEVNIAQTQHQIRSIEHHALHVFDTIESVDAPDELDIAWAPRCVFTHRLGILLNRQLRLTVVPSQRQMHDARRHFHVVDRRQQRFRAKQDFH